MGGLLAPAADHRRTPGHTHLGGQALVGEQEVVVGVADGQAVGRGLLLGRAGLAHLWAGRGLLEAARRGGGWGAGAGRERGISGAAEGTAWGDHGAARGDTSA